MIEFRNVSKTYKTILGRAVKAVEDFSLNVPAGEVFGIAGPNGAGKSTVIGMLLGYLRPSAGEIRIGGEPPRRYVERNGVGYLSELIAIPPRWKAEATLTRFAVLGGVEESRLCGAVDDAVAKLGLEEHREKRIKALSKGNLQRVGIAQAVTSDAKIFILDEPTHGLDPVWTQRFRDIISGLRAPDRIIIIASHNLDELQRLADRVAIIDHGVVQRVVDVRTTEASAGAVAYRLTVADGGNRIAAAFAGCADLGNGEFEILPIDLKTLNQTLAQLMLDGVVIRSVTPAHSALERQFREAVGEQR